MYPANHNDHYKALKTGQGKAQAAGHAGGMGKAWNAIMASLQGSKRTVFQGVGAPQTRADVVAPSRNATSIPSPTRLVSANLRAVIIAIMIGGVHLNERQG